MTNNSLKTLSVEDYDWLDVRYGCIQITEFEEDGDVFWGAAVLLNFDDGTEDGHNIFIPTNITDECKLCCAQNAGSFIMALCGHCISIVNVFTEDGDNLGEFDLNSPGFSHLSEHEDDAAPVEPPKRVLH